MSAAQDKAPRSYRSSRRAADAKRTRGRIIEAAGAVFVANGYAGATIRAIAARAGVSVPTVELFGTKARLLKAAIDVAIAGDDEPVAVLDRSWAAQAAASAGAGEFLSIVARTIGAAQARSAGLVLAVFEGSSKDPELAALTTQLIEQRATTAEWIVDGLAARAELRAELTRPDAADTMWLLMEPAVFDRLVRHRRWTVDRYQDWFARSAHRLLIADTTTSPSKPT